MKELYGSRAPPCGAKAYGTWYSQAVSHPSTNQARPCLASEIRRDRAFSGWYGRKREKRSQAGSLKEQQHGETHSVARGICVGVSA